MDVGFVEVYDCYQECLFIALWMDAQLKYPEVYACTIYMWSGDFFDNR